MHAELHLLVGIVLAHVFWAVAYAVGTLLDAGAARPATRSQALMDFVVRSASGIAVLAFCAFVLASLSWLNVAGLASLVPLFVVAGRAVHGRAFFTTAFWKDRLLRVGLAFGGTNLLLYYVALATIVPAAFPDIESDSVRYHLAYAMDWANHGGLFVDRFLRQPFYANNFLLVFSIMDVLHLEAYVHFVTWLCGALTVLAVRAALTLIDGASPPATSATARLSRAAVTVLLPLAIVVPVVYLRWLDTGLVDIPIELFVFIPVLCAAAALLSAPRLEWSAVCCAAFAIGMKATLIAFVPLFAVIVWVVFRSAGATRRAAAIGCSVMILAASPWYVRNLIYDGDPVPPVINLALHRPDLTYTQDDATQVLRDLKPDRSPEALAALPYRMWAEPLHESLREYGSSGLSLFLYVPMLVLCAGLAFGVRTPRTRALFLLSASTAYAVGYCLFTSYLMRYLLVTEAPLAASIGAILLIIPSVPIGNLARAAVAAFSVLPTPGALWWYQQRWVAEYQHFEQRYVSDADYLKQMLSGYSETERVLSMPPFRRNHPPSVLLVHVQTEYYFRLAGVQTVGDWFGPGRFEDLAAAIENERLADYVRYFDIGAVIFQRQGDRFFTAEQIAGLDRGLRTLGFRVLENNADGFFVAVRSESP